MAGPNNAARALAAERRYNASPRGRETRRRYHEAVASDRRMLLALANREGCVECGAKTPLDRHHTDPALKRFRVSGAVNSRNPKWADGVQRNVTFALFYDELMNHTIALCPQCHRAEHKRMATQ